MSPHAGSGANLRPCGQLRVQVAESMPGWCSRSPSSGRAPTRSFAETIQAGGFVDGLVWAATPSTLVRDCPRSHVPAAARPRLTGIDDANGQHLIEAGVGRIQLPRVLVEPDLAVDARL